MDDKEFEEKYHHIWCNYWMRPRKGCKSCERLYRLYPMGDFDMAEKYFPDAVEIKNDKNS